MRPHQDRTRYLIQGQLIGIKYHPKAMSSGPTLASVSSRKGAARPCSVAFGNISRNNGEGRGEGRNNEARSNEKNGEELHFTVDRKRKEDADDWCLE